MVSAMFWLPPATMVHFSPYRSYYTDASFRPDSGAPDVNGPLQGQVWPGIRVPRRLADDY